MERAWLRGRAEVWQKYGIGWRLLNRLVADRKIKRKKIGTIWFYKVESIDKYLNSGTKYGLA